MIGRQKSGMRGLELKINIMKLHYVGACGCDGRVVKTLDLKFNGHFPHRFKSCSQRPFSLLNRSTNST